MSSSILFVVDEVVIPIISNPLELFTGTIDNGVSRELSFTIILTLDTLFPLSSVVNCNTSFPITFKFGGVL